MSAPERYLKIIFLANASWNLLNYRLPLLQALAEAGHELLLLAPRDAYMSELVRLGFRWADVPMTRRGWNPFSEMRTILHLERIYRAEAPELVHHFTPKGVIYGSIAARLAGVRRVVNTITGLGYVYSARTFEARLLRPIVAALYRLAIGHTSLAFQNAEDMRRLGGLTSRAATVVLAGSGVNLARFNVVPEPAGTPVVMLAARLMVEKGVDYFVQAARLLQRQGVQARFVLVGDLEPGRAGTLNAAMLNAWVKEGVVEWWGWRDEMEQVYARAHIVCLPTYYGEGVPRSLVEAAACGRPIVATDIPGCRAVVEHGLSGLLVPVKNAAALAQALATLLQDAALRRSMGARGLEIAQRDFSARQHIREYFALYGLADPERVH